ncbi:hydrolase [Leptospira perolatii]|uniref:Hydrolase n=1 Tax=Leptospira perolatii TaxID=2023191 RepID=A0A2M9ZM04_9LEPT|nr:amidohydrolase family protein [Leptospira perolatii]PJZ69771.1 hydrolase [Leptospira perolatii]PJZ73014.1 hydrolase [Leptospira perolatii]
MEWEISNARAVTPKGLVENASIRVQKDRIVSVRKNNSGGPAPITIKLEGMFVYPGLINAHDHLLASYLPRVGMNRPYLNWLPWDNDLKSSVVFAERQQLEPEQLYYLGSYKNVISGVTSVQDHAPHFVQDPFVSSVPVRILNRFTLSHSICSYSLGWGEGTEIEYANAIKRNIPFITHISEGFDEESENALNKLESLGCLGDHSVLVHGIAFDSEDIRKIAKAKAHVIWCPESNLYTFGKTTDIRGLLKSNVNVSLGTDSPLSGSNNLLEEMKIARKYYQKQYEEDLSAETIFRMVTKNPAEAFRISKDLGSIEEEKIADLLVLSSAKEDPYEALLSADLDSIRLVVRDGKPVYGDASLKEFFDETGVSGQEIRISGIDKYLAGDPLGLIESVTRALGYKKDLAFFPIG